MIWMALQSIRMLVQFSSVVRLLSFWKSSIVDQLALRTRLTENDNT